MVRGANDSAPAEEFDFIITLIEFTESELVYQFNFTNPLSISIGTKRDIFR